MRFTRCAPLGSLSKFEEPGEGNQIRLGPAPTEVTCDSPLLELLAELREAAPSAQVNGQSKNPRRAQRGRTLGEPPGPGLPCKIPDRRHVVSPGPLLWNPNLAKDQGICIRLREASSWYKTYRAEKDIGFTDTPRRLWQLRSAGGSNLEV